MTDFQSNIIDYLNKKNNLKITIEDSGILVNGCFFQLLKCGSTPIKTHAINHIIHEDLWLTKQPIVQSRICATLGLSKRIYARETSVQKINKTVLLSFLQQNHLNIPVSAKHKYGLFYNDELVAVALFSKSCPVHRKGKVYRSHELIRFCNKNFTTVVGGLSKLIQHFIKEQHPEDIVSYVDLDWTNQKNNSFTQLGFQLADSLPPHQFIVDKKDMVRYHVNRVPKHLSPYFSNGHITNNRLVGIQNLGSLKYLKIVA